MRPSDEAFRAALREVVARSGLSLRGLSAAMGRDPGYVAALLDPGRPPRARPTPSDLLAASDATGIPLADLLEALWAVPRARLAAELARGSAGAALGPLLVGLDPAGRREVADFAAFLVERRGPGGAASGRRGAGR